MAKLRTFTVVPALPEPIKNLRKIAHNTFWAWKPELIELFSRIDNDLWNASGHNPIKLLASVPQKTLNSLAENPGYVNEVNRAYEKLNTYLCNQTWYEKNYKKQDAPVIAYFSAEFGIHESLPVYAGGLGILAGDHLKSASDLGIPLVAVGLMYQKGYFRQYLNIDGWQQEVFAENDFYNMPIKIVRRNDGSPLTLTIKYPKNNVEAQIWKLDIARVKLYLLDTNLPQNSPQDRIITESLYGGDREMRMKQEIMLGIGGLRALNAMDINPKVCHMNEGHAAFMALERIRLLIEKHGVTFEQALDATKPANAFTIHTPVKAGLDEFSVELVDKYLSDYIPQLNITKKQFLELGSFDSEKENEPFKMPVLALKLSAYRNGVSKLHGEVSRKMWLGLWPQVPANEIPITSITNGVHVETWLSKEMNELYETYLGLDWTDQTVEGNIWKKIQQIPEVELWRAHQRCKLRLIAVARNILKKQMQRRGTYHTELNWAEEVLDPEALTIGFARRFATYKRGNLLLSDPKRLINLLNNKERPLQIIFSGKAHPKDSEGKEIIRRIIHFANQHDVRRRLIFLEDYDINLARFLVQGVDIWLNNPRRPMEASGTSGMKATINGALNVSTLDGWWCEGYKPEIGWAIGSGEVYNDASYQDMVESQALYNLLENEVVPLFYTRSADNLPRAWIKKIKNSVESIGPKFNTHRMVTQYVKNFYEPARQNYDKLSENSMAAAKEFTQWRQNLAKKWKYIEIRDVQLEILNNNGEKNRIKPQPAITVGSRISVNARIHLAQLKPHDVSVQVYEGAVDPWQNIKDGSLTEMKEQKFDEQNQQYLFNAVVPCTAAGRRAVAVRILPKHKYLVGPHELGLILWEKTAQTSQKTPVTVS